MTSATIDTDLDAVVARAADAAPVLAASAPTTRARALTGVADALEAAGPSLVEIAMRETGLTEARLTGELARTAVQLRLFADVVVECAYLDARIDPADDDFALGVRPDLRRTHVPIGPVINFAASNFPFAFSVMGGDSAAILAAGCPLIVKAHSGHPELSDATARIAARALEDAGLPPGAFQLIHGREAGVAVLRDPRIRAGSFTGSIGAGRLLADIAAARPAPIPFFGELGSVNPVFVTALAVQERSAELARGFIASVSGSAGQLCTKPGLVFVERGTGFPDAIRRAADDVAEHRLLDPRIARAYGARRDLTLATPGVHPIVEGRMRFDDEGHGWATPTIVSIGLDSLRRDGRALLDETFGPLSVVVEVPSEDAFAALVPELTAGNLTGTVHLGSTEADGHGENRDALRALVDALARQTGRVLFDGWPTGVAVTPAQQHGGPWPATTNDSSTSVGTAAIGRFVRPVAYQNAPPAFLPPILLDDNPLGAPRTVSAAGASRRWGERAASTTDR